LALIGVLGHCQAWAYDPFDRPPSRAFVISARTSGSGSPRSADRSTSDDSGPPIRPSAQAAC